MYVKDHEAVVGPLPDEILLNMYIGDLESVVDHITDEILKNITVIHPAPQPTFTGIVKGQAFNSETLAKHYPRRPHVSDDDFQRDMHVVDPSTNAGGGDSPVVVAVAINHGREADVIKCRGGAGLPTQVRGQLDKTFQILEDLNPGNLHYEIPLPGAYHLLLVNLFPELTATPWSNLRINTLEEALLLNLHGYRVDALLAPLEDLLRRLADMKGEPVTWIVFYGSNNCVPLIGALYAKRNDCTHQPEIMICDDLRNTGPIKNCIVLDRSPVTRGETDRGNVDE